VPRARLRRRTAIILASAIVVLAAAVAFGFSRFIEGSQKRLLTGIHDNCVSSAAGTARARGVDVAQPDIAEKIEHYCDCVTDSVESGKVTATELNTFSADPQAADPGAAKVRQIVAICLR
jgi:hypothetical protein